MHLIFTNYINRNSFKNKIIITIVRIEKIKKIYSELLANNEETKPAINGIKMMKTKTIIVDKVFLGYNIKMPPFL